MPDSSSRFSKGSGVPGASLTPSDPEYRLPAEREQTQVFAEASDMPGFSLAQKHTKERVLAAKLRLESGQLHQPGTVVKAVDRLVEDVQQTR